MHKEAIEVYKQVIRIKPDSAEARYFLGLIYLWKLNDRNSALEEYKILKELDKEKANELFNLIYK
jgi:tetratricopeptide (TPR) repeat protein